MRQVMIVAVASFICGCSTNPIKDEESQLNYGNVDDRNQAILAAQPCASPVPARVNVSRDFRYGCFCGIGYPALKLDGLPGETTGHYNERLALAYYRVKPVDQVDDACQRHDICYMLNQHSQLACNARFNHDLGELEKNLTSEIGLTDTDNYQFRCSVMINDIEIAAVEFMPASSTVPGSKVGAEFGRALSLPVVLAAGLGRKFLGGPYPTTGELCNAASP